MATNVYQRIKAEEKREEASLIISMGKLINNNQGCKYITYLYNSVQLNATLLFIKIKVCHSDIHIFRKRNQCVKDFI